VLVDDLGEIVSERALARADDAAADADTVGVGDRRRVVERGLQCRELGLEVRVERQLLRDDERCDEDDAGAPIAGQAAGEVERMLGLGATEQRDDDTAVADRRGPPGEAAGAVPQRVDVRELHYRTW
jgi:hypothetical protein